MLLAILKETLHQLHVDGRTGLLRDLKFSFLWAVPNLRQLSLENVAHHIHQEDFKRGIACLR